MPEENAPLEEILEAAEAAVAAQEDESPQVLVIGLGAMALLTGLVALILGMSVGAGIGGEQRVLAMAVPPEEAPEAYAERIVVENAEVTFVETMFESRELRANGWLHNAGNQVVAHAKLVLVVKHLFGDERYEYVFAPISSVADGVGSTGPLLAGQSRQFFYRVPDVPADISSRVVRISWRVEDVKFHPELPIPTKIPAANRAG